MGILIGLTELLLYLSFSLLMGALILLLVPDHLKPPVRVNPKLIQACALLVTFGSFLPVLPIVDLLSSSRGWGSAFIQVIFEFAVGRAFLLTALFSMLLLLIWTSKGVKEKAGLLYLSLGLVAAMTASYSMAAHAASMGGSAGHVFHTLHFLGASVWIGLLLMVSWYAVSKKNWGSFLRWYTPTAVTSLIVVFAAGYFTMSVDLYSFGNPDMNALEGYAQALPSNYGQALLVKHLFVIGILLFALINGVLFRKKAGDQRFNPLPWTKAESGFALGAFALTAAMGRAGTPNQEGTKGEEASFLYRSFTGESGSELIEVTMSFGPVSWMLGLIGSLFLLLTIASAVKRPSLGVVTAAGSLMIVSFYLAVMTAV